MHHEAAFEEAVGSERLQVRSLGVAAHGAWRYAHLGTRRRSRGRLLGFLETARHAAIPVEVASIGDGVVDLKPIGDVMPPPGPPRSGLLVIDMAWLLNRANRQLANADATPFATIATGIRSPYARPRQHRLPRGLVDLLRQPEQLAAVELALNCPVSWILGPPGTGKTTTAAGIVRACADLGLTVDVYAPAHRALDELQERLDDFGVAYLRMGEDPYARSEAILATLAWAVLARPSRADIVLIDEASMASLPYVFLAAQRPVRSLVLIGDPCQLEPVVRVTADFLLRSLTERWELTDRRAPGPTRESAWAEMRRVKRWLARDTFVASGVAQQLAAGGIAQHAAALRVQRRMLDPICQLVNAISYNLVNAPLLTHPSVAERAAQALPPLGLVDVETQFSDGHASPAHAEASRRLVDYLVGRGLPPEEVAVITPTRAQAELLRTRLPRAIRVHTTHASQGAEYQAVVLDLSCGRRPPKGFFGGVSATDSGTRLLTVGASRARRALYVVADALHLAETCPAHGSIARLLGHLHAAVASQPLPVH